MAFMSNPESAVFPAVLSATMAIRSPVSAAWSRSEDPQPKSVKTTIDTSPATAGFFIPGLLETSLPWILAVVIW